MLNDLYAFVYIGATVYFLTLGMIMSIYALILRHMKLNAFRSSSSEIQKIAEERRQRREFRIYSRLLVLISILFVMGVPYCTFFFLSAINGLSPPPPFADRICILFIVVGHGIDMALSLVYTDDVRKIFMAIWRGARPNQVQCVNAISLRPRKT